MARTNERGSYRPILTTLLDGKDFQQLSAMTRWVFVALKMRLGPAGIEVHYRDALAIEMAEQTGVPADGVRAAFDELQAADWVRFERNVVWIVRQLEFEPNMVVTNANHRLAVQRHVAGLPHLPIVEAFEAYYAEWMDAQTIPSSDSEQPTENPSEGELDAIAMASPIPSRSPKTEDRDRVPITDNPEPNGSPSRKRAHQLPGDWQPNEKHHELATERGVDITFEAEQFRDHAEATGRTLKSWDAGFRTWLRKANPRQHTNGKRPGRKITGDYLAAVLLSAGSLVWQPETRDDALCRLAERYTDAEWGELCPYFEEMPWHEVVPAQSDKFMLREVLNRHIERHDHATA